MQVNSSRYEKRNSYQPQMDLLSSWRQRTMWVYFSSPLRCVEWAEVVLNIAQHMLTILITRKLVAKAFMSPNWLVIDFNLIKLKIVYLWRKKIMERTSACSYANQWVKNKLLCCVRAWIRSYGSLLSWNFEFKNLSEAYVMEMDTIDSPFSEIG